MTKYEFAQEIAQATNSKVKEMEKANGVKLTGIEIPTGSTNAAAVVYIDSMYEAGLTVDEATEKINAIKEREASHQINIDLVNDFEKVKPLLRARLYNQATTADVFRSAAEYGFNDLIIIAYIEDVIKTPTGTGSIKVTSGLVESWNTTPDEVLRIAEENSRKDATIKTIMEVMQELGHVEIMEDIPLSIVSNSKQSFGAYSIIALMDELKKRYKNGFTVLPSSVHEVIITEIDESEKLDTMVNEVNEETVNPEEQLSNHAYRIAA